MSVNLNSLRHRKSARFEQLVLMAKVQAGVPLVRGNADLEDHENRRAREYAQTQRLHDEYNRSDEMRLQVEREAQERNDELAAFLMMVTAFRSEAPAPAFC